MIFPIIAAAPTAEPSRDRGQREVAQGDAQQHQAGAAEPGELQEAREVRLSELGQGHDPEAVEHVGPEQHREVELERRLTFRWLPFRRTAVGNIAVVAPTRVEIILEEVAGGTRVRVVERPVFPDRRRVPPPRGALTGVAS